MGLWHNASTDKNLSSPFWTKYDKLETSIFSYHQTLDVIGLVYPSQLDLNEYSNHLSTTHYLCYFYLWFFGFFLKSYYLKSKWIINFLYASNNSCNSNLYASNIFFTIIYSWILRLVPSKFFLCDRSLTFENFCNRSLLLEGFC